MASDPKAPEVMEWQQEEGGGGSEERAECSSVQAPSLETTVTHLLRSHSVDRTPRSPIRLGFMANYRGKAQRGRRRTPEPTGESLMAVRIRRLDQILGRFDPNSPQAKIENILGSAPFRPISY